MTRPALALATIPRALAALLAVLLAAGGAPAAFGAEDVPGARQVALDLPPVDPARVDPAPVDPAPVDPAPVDPAPAHPASVDPAPADPAAGDRSADSQGVADPPAADPLSAAESAPAAPDAPAPGAAERTAPVELLDAITEVTVERSWRDSTGVYVELGVRWSAPPEAKGGDWFTLGLPAEFPASMPGFDLRDADGVRIARAEIADRVVTFTLDPVVDGLLDVQGWARFSMRISTSSSNTTITRSFVYNGEVYELDIWIPGSGGGIAAQLVVGKRGEYLTGLGDGRTWLTWRIYTPAGPADRVVIRDLPGRGLELVCDAAALPAGAPQLVQLIKYTRLPDANNVAVALDPADFAEGCRGDRLELELPPLAMNEKYRLTVLTRVNPAYPDALTNRAEVELDEQRRTDSWTVQNQNSGGAAGGTPVPRIDIEKWSLLDGAAAGDHDAAPGKLLIAGAKEDLAFTIRNTGSEPLIDLVVSDRTTVGDIAIERLGCDFTRLGGPADALRWSGPFYPGESFECRGVLPGLPAGAQHADLAGVTATGRTTGTAVADEDPWYGATEPDAPFVPTVVDPPTPAVPAMLLETGGDANRLLMLGITAVLAGLSALCFIAAARLRRAQRAAEEQETPNVAEEQRA